jgi:aquaporin Z
MNPRNALVEFVGTFFFVLVIGLVVSKAATGVVAPGAGDFAPLVIGCTLMVLVCAGGHISGGHFNPAVTLGVFLRGKCKFADVIPYMVAQCVGAVLAGLLVNYIKGGPQELSPTPDVTKALIVEFLFTYWLVNNVLNSATSKTNSGNSYYPIAIGFTIVVAAYAGGGISGGAYNPAIACGLTALGIKPLAGIWMFWVPNFLGAAAAAGMYRFINPDEEYEM